VSIEWLRDLVIVIFGLAATIVVILFGILGFILYRKLMPVIKSVKTTTKTAEDISSCFKDLIATPLAYFASIVQGVFQVFKLVGRFSGRKEGR